jgi:putative membrane protein
MSRSPRNFFRLSTLAAALAAASLGVYAQSQPGTQPSGAAASGKQSSSAASGAQSSNTGSGAQSSGAGSGAQSATATSGSQAGAKSGGKSGAQLAGDDRKFVEKAAMHGMAEVEMGKLAQQKAGNEQVKQFGARMVQDHGKANDELKQIASAKGVTLPSAPDKEHQRHMERLSKLSGEQFDREYMKHMVKDHRADVKEFEKQSKGGKDGDIKGFAGKNLPTLQEHLRMAQATEASVKDSGGKGRTTGDRGNNSSNAASRGGTGSGPAPGSGASGPQASAGSQSASTTSGLGASGGTTSGRIANPSGSANQSSASTTQSGTGASTREANKGAQ